MKKLLVTPLVFIFIVNAALSQQEENLDLMNAALFVAGRFHLIGAWENHCVNLNPVQEKYYSSLVESWVSNNSEVIGISSKVLESFKAGNAELYETLVRDLSKNIERQQSTIDIEHRLEHCENFFNGVSENKQDIAHLNLKAFNVLMEYR